MGVGSWGDEDAHRGLVAFVRCVLPRTPVAICRRICAERKRQIASILQMFAYRHSALPVICEVRTAMSSASPQRFAAVRVICRHGAPARVPLSFAATPCASRLPQIGLLTKTGYEAFCVLVYLWSNDK